MSPCGGRRKTGHRPGGRERRKADRAAEANGHRSFLWRPTWIPAFAGMTVLLLCGHGRRRCRTGAVVVRRRGHDRQRCPTAAAVVGRCGHGRQRCRTVAIAVRRRDHDRRCRPWRAGGQRRPFPRNPSPMSDTTPTRSAPHPPPPSSPRRRGSTLVALRRTPTRRDPAGMTLFFCARMIDPYGRASSAIG